ncbi:MAG: hypothetical protein JST81_03605 [Bacteroidetes bacterium]|nr:hypothetical protein [Bacteroidota bacterium]
MNLHVCNDEYGLYPFEIAQRIYTSPYADNNLMVNLTNASKIRHDKITYIPVSSSAFKRYINTLSSLDKIIFHPYNLHGHQFLEYVLKRFPDVKVYWVCWSYELYKLPRFAGRMYEPYSASFLKSSITIQSKFRNFLKKVYYGFVYGLGLQKNYFKSLEPSFARINYFCCWLPSDYAFFLSLSPKKDIVHLPFSYFSLTKIMPDLHSYTVSGNEVMIGHSALPDGNHYEIIRKLSAIDKRFPIFLPLVYGNVLYSKKIKEIARAHFDTVYVQEEKLDKEAYYQRLTKVGWVIINSKVQQGLGNILAIIWMGAKLFLDENSGTYIDFKKWNIIVFSVQHDLTKEQLSTRLTAEQIEHNRRILYEKVNEEKVSEYWEPLLN